MKTYEPDIAVIGAGAAGLSAAYQAASAGAKVLVIDENKLPGGQLFKQIHKFFGSHEHKAGTRGYQIGQEMLAQVKETGADIMLDSLAYGLLPNMELGIVHEGKAAVVKAKKYIIASGAKENYLAMPGSTLPGVMGAGAAQTMINVNRVLPGKKVVMVGSGNVGLIVSYQLLQAGAEVVALVEAAPQIGGYGVHAGKLRRAGVPIHVATTIKRVLGEQRVTGVELVDLGPGFQQIPGTERIMECDTVCLAVGLNPMTELAWMAGCKFDFIPALGGHVPMHDENMKTTLPDVYVAGDITGVEEASSAMEEGNLAGIAAAEALGYLTEQQASEKKQAVWGRLDVLRSGQFGQKRRDAKKLQIEHTLAYLAGLEGGNQA